MIARRTITGFLAATALALLLQACATAEAPKAKTDVKVTGSYVTLISDEGRARIARSQHKVDYVSLMATFTMHCPLYTSDADDDLLRLDLCGPRNI